MVMGTAIVSGSLLVTLISSCGISLGLTLQLKRNEFCSDRFMVRQLVENKRYVVEKYSLNYMTELCNV